MDYAPDWPGTTIATESYVEGWVGNTKVCGRIDRAVSVSAKQSKLYGIPKGKYIIDYKTVGSFQPTWALYYDMGFQRILYPYLWGSKIDGFLLIGISKAKFGGVKLLKFNYPTPDEIETLRQVLRDANNNREKALQLESTGVQYVPTNPTKCADWNKPCPHFILGRCDRVVRRAV
jgi:hypothetical protein